MLQHLAQLTVNGIITGTILALTAVGVTLVFGIQRIAKFAYGEYLTCGAYVALVVNVGLGLNLFIAAIAAVLATAGLAVVLHFVVLKPLAGRGLVATSLITVGLGLMARDVVFLVAGPRIRKLVIDQTAVFDLGLVRISPGQAVAVAITLITVPAVAYFLARTTAGKAMRAVADNRDLAAVSGIDVERMGTLVWSLAGALAGILYSGTRFLNFFPLSLFDSGSRAFLRLFLVGLLLVLFMAFRPQGILGDRRQLLLEK